MDDIPSDPSSSPLNDSEGQHKINAISYYECNVLDHPNIIVEKDDEETKVENGLTGNGVDDISIDPSSAPLADSEGQHQINAISYNECNYPNIIIGKNDEETKVENGLSR